MVKVLDHGHVELLEVMPHNQDITEAITSAARVSYGSGTKSVSDNITLMRYLFRNHHTSPFEMVELKWRVKLPLFVARQWIRHRTASVNEISARYSDVTDADYYVPDFRVQSTSNKQCSEDRHVDAHIAADLKERYIAATEQCREAYEQALKAGVAREVARTVLPVSMYTEWIWKCDLHNTLKFLSQRMHTHAQWEIRQYAQAMHDTLQQLCPDVMQAWQDYEVNCIRFTANDIRALSGDTSGMSKRECSEFEEKRKVLFHE